MIISNCKRNHQHTAHAHKSHHTNHMIQFTTDLENTNFKKSTILILIVNVHETVLIPLR